MTVKKLYRLVNITWRQNCLVLGENHRELKNHLCRVKVSPLQDFFQYKTDRVGPVLSPNSDELLKAGDHLGICTRSGVRAAVLERDGSTCCFTGQKLDIGTASVEWIVPPILYYEMEVENMVQRYEEMQEVSAKNAEPIKRLMVAQNAITMHVNLVDLFRLNVLSVDCEDEDKYRIVCFDQEGLDVTLRRNLLINGDANNRLDDRYLDRHFSRALLTHTTDRCIKDEIDLDAIGLLASERGWSKSADINLEEDFDRSRDEDLDEDIDEDLAADLAGIGGNEEAQWIHKWYTAYEKTLGDSG
ncbi:hypothetical protein DXG03_001936 [Asterophora parasitica]|uniref:Uncharacterized protein n=1 Tax=Asterophora parasitica TaxID=117018 RepID=A0A9P7FX59_9AGAR|nr:hypothetical protein DXG03_001936 [Asterophora parasitica]